MGKWIKEKKEVKNDEREGKRLKKQTKNVISDSER